MSSLDRALNNLLDLGNPSVRRDRSEQLDQAMRTLLALTEADAAAILLPGRGERLVLHTGSAVPSLVPRQPEGSEVARVLAGDPHPVSVPDLLDEPRLATHDACPGVESGPALFLAIRKRHATPGYLAVYRRRGRARFAAADVRAGVLLATTLQHSLEAQRLSRGIEKLALTDDLTEVYNARFVKSAMRRELRRAARFDQELSLLLVDANIETASSESDRDAWTRELAGRLVQQVRSFDFVARLEGDRFLVVLPQTPRAGSAEVAERIRTAVQSSAFPGAAPGTVTVTIGLSSFPQDGNETRTLIATAERGLDAAGAAGLDQAA